MKRMIAVAMVLVLASLFTLQANSEQIKTQMIYSLDQYDGFIHYARAGGNMMVLNENLIVTTGGSIWDTPFVTFDLTGIDFTKVKTITFHVYQILGRKTLNMKISFWQVIDTDYQKWQNCQFNQFGDSKVINRTNHIPENCGFPSELTAGTWYNLIRYEPVKQSVKMTKNHDLSWWWHSDDFENIAAEYFKGKRYMTIALYPDLRNYFTETAEYADGDKKNGEFRPYLEVKY
jgi:hypothetical protein